MITGKSSTVKYFISCYHVDFRSFGKANNILTCDLLVFTKLYLLVDPTQLMSAKLGGHPNVLVCPKPSISTVYPNKYAHGFVVLCFVVVMQSFIMNSHEVFIHIHQGCFAGTGAMVRLPQCQWSKPDGYGKISQCITTTKHSKEKTVCIFLVIYCSSLALFFIC